LCLGGHTVKKIGISNVVLLKPPVPKKGSSNVVLLGSFSLSVDLFCG
jgi:hypothetical protein